MAAPLHEPKELTEWLDLDAHQRPRPFQRSRWGLYVLLAFVVGGGVLLWGYWSSNTIYQAQPVSLNHKMFSHNCQVCHEESFVTLKRVVPGNEHLRSVPDSACLKCHNGARHQPQSALAESPSCVSCHREHRGETSLASVSQTQCLRCHRDLNAVTAHGHSSAFETQIDSWAAHPAFAKRWSASPQGTDPGTIRFGHAQHLVPTGLPSLDLEQLKQRGLESKEQRLVELEKLTCNACHQLDEEGAYMLPVRYDQHCQRCHPLWVAFDPATNDAGIRQRAQLFRDQPAPHQEPLIVRGVLRERLHQFITDPLNRSLLKEPPIDGAPRPAFLPGWPRPRLASPKEGEFVHDHLVQMERRLFFKDSDGGCKYCHQLQPNQDDSRVPKYELSQMNARFFPDTKTTSLKWFPHANFDHQSHRALDCLACHPNIDTSRDTEALHMPKIDTCRQCHSDGGSTSARTTCIECHSYHPKQQQQREFRANWTVEQLRRGNLTPHP